MNSKRFGLRAWCVLCAMIIAIGLLAVPGVQVNAIAQSTTHHHKNIVQRHPMMSSMAAGYAAYKAAKVTGNNRMAVGRKKNLAQRHPILTGMAAAAVTHHMIKKSMKH